MFSAFKRPRPVLLVENGEDANQKSSQKRPTSLQVCLQLALICACVVILFFGLAVTAIGFWGYKSQEDYLTITDRDPELTRLPFSMMVTGGFVAILGLVGVLGSLFSRTITGQTLLGVFSFVLVLVIISEVGAGAAAIKLKFELKDVFMKTAEASLKEYTTNQPLADRWDNFQEDNDCCGVSGYVNATPPYYDIFHNVSVPMSCCNDKVEDQQQCEVFAQDATKYRDYIYERGCAVVAVHTLTQMVTLIAIVAITIGSTQLLAVFLAVIVAYMSSKLDNEKSSYSYKKLLQEEVHQGDNTQLTPT